MPLAHPVATLEHYRQHLVLLRRWLVPIESWQANFLDGPQGADMLPDLGHVSLIDADLAHASMPTDYHILPAADLWPASDATAYRWGVSYVIEGSRLGGHVLRRRLAERLAPHPLRYLGDEDGAGERWSEFVRLLRRAVNQEDAINAACCGACDAFDSLLALLPAENMERQSA
jgi:heme oxygenase